MRGALLVTMLLLAGCTTYKDQLARSQHALEARDAERSLALLQDLDAAHLSSPAEQATYAYLRGAADLELGHRQDAYHWLSLARAHDEASPGALPGEWKAKTTAALAELSAVVFSQGYAALAKR